MKREELTRELNRLFEPEKFADYCPNGLQVEGRNDIQRVITGVSASQALLDAALARKADAIIVHHGYFWKGENPAITGLKKRRLQSLLSNNINLYAYHLPLDAHKTLGNNAQIAAHFGWQVEGTFMAQDIGFYGNLPEACSLSEISDLMTKALSRKPLQIGDDNQQIKKLAWCSGGAQNGIEEAVQLGVDLYISGEISEQTTHIARESGIAYLAIGHHASECFGISALTKHLSAEFALDCKFIQINNPA